MRLQWKYRDGRYLCSRRANPTVAAFGKKLAAMEGIEAALGLASGMAAIACALEQILPEGGHVVSSRAICGGTYALFSNIFPRRGIRVAFVDPDGVSAFERPMGPETKVLFPETMSNPLLGISDLIAGAVVGRAKFIEELVDITRGVVMLTGPVMGPKIAHLLCLRLDHPPIRMAAHSREAGCLAARMRLPPGLLRMWERFHRCWKEPF